MDPILGGFNILESIQAFTFSEKKNLGTEQKPSLKSQYIVAQTTPYAMTTFLFKRDPCSS